MPDSRVNVRIQDGRVRLHLVVPHDRLAMALISLHRVPDPGPGFTRYPDLSPAIIGRYVRDRIRVAAGDGPAWPLQVMSVSGPAGPRQDWAIDVDAMSPDRATPAVIRLDYDVVIKDVIPDAAIVALEQDWRQGVLPGHPVLLGKLEREDRSIRITRSGNGGFRALAGLFSLGIWHILEGADHLAFLLTLLLTVGLVAVEGRWRPATDPGQVLRDTVWRISAFTLGHTLSLLATSLGLLPQAGRTIEVLIALSVAVSAAHAMLPLFPRREVYLAGTFGLVHGMAFATVIRELDLSIGQTLAATLAFNLGIEAIQLGLVVVVLPLVLLVRRTPIEPLVRMAAAAWALLFAIYWMIERLLPA